MLKIKSNIRYFDNDDEFYQFCVVPQLVPVEYTDADGNTHHCATFNLSQQYLNDLENGIQFVIKDENSQIFKHGSVSYRTITKPISGLIQYFPLPGTR